MRDKNNGLHCSVLRDGGSRYDCTNGGISSKHDRLTLTGDGVRGPFDPSDDAPEIRLMYDLDPQGAAAGYLAVGDINWLAELGIGQRAVGEMECFSPDWSKRHQIVRVRAVPIVDGKPKGGMFGGNFITTCDSRWPVEGPIPVFDRFE